MASVVVFLERATRLASPARLAPWLLAVWVALLALPAAARELHWRELAVTARLDAEGRLHVSELHRMVFTGDYNGGERSFRVQGDQALELEGMSETQYPPRVVRATLRPLVARLVFRAYKTESGLLVGRGPVARASTGLSSCSVAPTAPNRIPTDHALIAAATRPGASALPE